jgi:phosphoribosylaminoimidazole-succinocarboxamide synthase
MNDKIILDINLPGFELFDRGKIRDVFEVGDDLLVATTDRVYAFDRIFPGGLTGKGRVLTALTVWSMELARGLIDNYVITSRAEEFPEPLKKYSGLLEGRSFLTKKIVPIRVECVARGYLYGQAWGAYQKGDFFWGSKLPSGMRLAQELPRILFTPARKERSGDDENINEEELAVLLGEERARQLREITIAIYERLREEWAKRGFILADTKFEFGLLGDRLLLINEVGTPDCSRIWKASEYRPGQIQDSWDKEVLEHYLRRKGWSPASPPMPFSNYIRRKLQERFEQLVSLI